MNNTENCSNDFIEIKQSPVHGKGLFAKINIPEGTEICVIQGEFIDEAECVRREDDENNNYIFWHSDENYIDVDKNFLRFLNHDCDPKCYVEENDDTTLLLIAEKDICAGEEITIDYEYDEIYDYCNCPQCREKREVV
jgi:uncharacterized protein